MEGEKRRRTEELEGEDIRWKMVFLLRTAAREWWHLRQIFRHWRVWLRMVEEKSRGGMEAWEEDVRGEDELPGTGLLQRNWWYLPGFEC
jgi:hypothetical protein